MSARVRLVVLLALLVVMVGALAYDQLSARPKSEEAHRICQEMVDANAAVKGKPTIGEQEVQEKIGPPTAVDKQELYEVHRHSWRRGLIFRTYDVNVVYAKRDGKLILQHVFLNQPVEEYALPSRAKIEPISADAAKQQPPPGIGGPGIPGAGGPGIPGGPGPKPPTVEGSSPANPDDKKPSDPAEPAEKPAAKPADKPAETPGEKNSEDPK